MSLLTVAIALVWTVYNYLFALAQEARPNSCRPLNTTTDKAVITNKLNTDVNFDYWLVKLDTLVWVYFSDKSL